ncbi:MAG: hypothetical protein JSV45_15310 [Chromatiales bacterium]|nr:MAG: hypothetical protein JSV45_15310 [Chromatiales bacterium]
MGRASNLRALAASAVALSLFIGAKADIDPVTGRAIGGDVGPRNFAEYCAGELSADRKEKFYAERDKAERAIAAGNPGDAEAAMYEALGAVYRGGSEESDVPVKCLGQPTARRWLAMRLDLYRLQTQQASNERARAPQLFTAADRGGSAAVVSLVSDQRAGDFRSSLRALEGFIERVTNEREYGAFILAEEDAIATAFRDANGPLLQFANQQHRDALNAEDQAFHRAPTEQEFAAAGSVGSAEMLAKAVAGVELDTAMEREAILTGIRVGESQQFLGDARDWNLDQYSDVSALPSSQRARQRGDTMLAKANDTTQGLEVRDNYYEDAEWYYEFGEFDDLARTAKLQRAAIQPALQAERERREEQMEQAAADMEKKAEAVQQAVDDMQKTEAEKKSFNEEADALEAELGF